MPQLSQGEREAKTLSKLIYGSVERAFSAPSDDPRKSSKYAHERLQYITDIIVGALIERRVVCGEMLPAPSSKELIPTPHDPWTAKEYLESVTGQPWCIKKSDPDNGFEVRSFEVHIDSKGASDVVKLPLLQMHLPVRSRTADNLSVEPTSEEVSVQISPPGELVAPNKITFKTVVWFVVRWAIAVALIYLMMNIPTAINYLIGGI